MRRHRFACAGARDRGTCSNHLTIRGDHLEAAILAGLKTRLMDPALFEAFAREFLDEVNRQRMAVSAARAGLRAELDRVSRQIKRLVDAILEGADAKPLNSRLKELETERTRLTAELDAAPEEKVRLSPNLARIYRERVESLEQVLRDPQHGREAFELIRSLIEEVRLVPADGQLGIELKGELAGILALADGAKRAAAPHEQTALQIKMVAGDLHRNSRNTPPPT